MLKLQLQSQQNQFAVILMSRQLNLSFWRIRSAFSVTIGYDIHVTPNQCATLNMRHLAIQNLLLNKNKRNQKFSGWITKSSCIQ